jgi:hypothetical protein
MSICISKHCAGVSPEASARALRGVTKKAEAKIARADKLTIPILILARETRFLFMMVSFSLKRSPAMILNLM